MKRASRSIDSRIQRIVNGKSDDAVEWVKQIALFLIDHGVQARLDKFHLRRGMDLPQWMCNELALANKVIVICDESTNRKPMEGLAALVGKP